MPRFAKYTFLVAGVYGLLVTVPMYFSESRINATQPPAITHPEYFYGFAGLCLAWQLMFLLISTDPARYRPAMPVAIVEKAAFAIAVPILYLQNRAPGQILAASLIDAVLGLLFLISYLKTPAPVTASPDPQLPHRV